MLCSNLWRTPGGVILDRATRANAKKRTLIGGDGDDDDDDDAGMKTAGTMLLVNNVWS